MRLFKDLWIGVKILLLLVFFQFQGVQEGVAQVRRALLIGINEYNSNNAVGEWQNLEGAVNDAQSVASMLKARYGFKSRNIELLTKNAETSRKGIVKAFEKITEKVESGDVVMFYYAGHGTQVRNSSFYEEDKLHEAIVPSDGSKGIDRYILDVEMNHYFNQILDKGAQLNVIIDGCHSGSGSRGKLSIESYKTRYVPSSALDIKKKFEKSVSLAERGAMVLSAAHDFQLAKEFKDLNNNSHGAFTYALLKAMQTGNANEPVANLHKRINSIMKYHAIPKQNPVIEVSSDRASQPLFGGVSDGGQSEKLMIGVIDAKEDGYLVLDGGYAVGINKGSKLVKQLDNGDKVEVEVESVNGLVESVGKVKSEADYGKIEAGDLLELDGWMIGGESFLTVWSPDAVFSEAELKTLSEEVQRLKSDMITLVKDPVEEEVTHLLTFVNNEWVLVDCCGSPEVKLGSKLTAKKLRNILKAEKCGKVASVKLFVNFPPPTSLLTKLKQSFGDNSSVQFTTSPSSANYILTGSYNSGSGLSYGWVHAHLDAQKSQQAGEKELDQDHPMPINSDWQSLKDGVESVTGMLVDHALQLGKIKSWLTLESPPSTFPYSIAMKNANTGAILDGGVLTSGNSYGLVLVKNVELYKQWDEQNQFVYVFVIDSHGGMSLVFPTANSGLGENGIKQMGLKDGFYIKEIPITGPTDIGVVPPYGTDNLIMLTSDNPISDLSVFQSVGVKHGTTTARGSSPVKLSALEKLLQSRSKSTRSKPERTPNTWSIEHVHFTSVERNND
ncbi:caspase family protein [Limibacter armeniacum]|uniref:caspase family protein n=1 Tax=Limibacter armeniacum TaxID=466084 RepID=UPI002FE52C14